MQEMKEERNKGEEVHFFSPDLDLYVKYDLIPKKRPTKTKNIY